MSKASVHEIRQRFDKDVERFSNIETGQHSAMDAPLALDLSIKTIRRLCPKIGSILDVGCGAGNYTLKLLHALEKDNPLPECHLLDLSEPMLLRARERINRIGPTYIKLHCLDIREAQFDDNSFDVVMAAAVFHHLRAPEEWEMVFKNIYKSLRPEGVLVISDLVSHNRQSIDTLIQEYYGAYLVQIGGTEYKRRVFDYIAYEDTPSSVLYQLDLLRQVGFHEVDILHKNACFATFYAKKN